MMELQKLYTDKRSFETALNSLPVSSLVAIASEIMRARGATLDCDDKMEEALDKLYFDIVAMGSAKLEDYSDFETLMNWHYKSFDSQEWYQRMISAMPSESA